MSTVYCIALLRNTDSTELFHFWSAPTPAPGVKVTFRILFSPIQALSPGNFILHRLVRYCRGQEKDFKKIVCFSVGTFPTASDMPNF